MPVTAKVFISVDLEGVAGVATVDQVVSGQRGYLNARALMTAEANAAAAGAFDAGATRVTVSDGHGTMDNLFLDELDRRVELVSGAPRRDGMMEGITSEHDVALFVGYHAGAGTRGVLAHSYSPHFLELRLNGTPASEAELNALQAAAVGVPLGLLTGDDCICRTVEERLPQVRTVAVKTALGFSTARSLSATEACQRIREASAAVTERSRDLEPVRLPESLAVEIDLPHATAAERGAMLAGVERIGDRTVRGAFERPEEAIALVMTCSQLAAAAMRARLPLIGR